MRLPKITLILASLIILVYIILSQSLLYIPTSIILQLGFDSYNPWGLILYTFLHVSPNHIFGNLLLLLFIGTIAEQKLSNKDMLIIYFASSLAAAITFTILTPNTVLVGASAAISGLIAAAIVVDVKKTVLAIVSFSVIVFIIGPPLLAYSQSQLDLLTAQTNDLFQKYNDTTQQLVIAQQQNDTAAIENLSQQLNDTYYELNASTTVQNNIQEGVDREKSSKTSSLAHIVGALVGFIYMWRIRPDLLWAMPYQIIPKRYLARARHEPKKTSLKRALTRRRR